MPLAAAEAGAEEASGSRRDRSIARRRRRQRRRRCLGSPEPEPAAVRRRGSKRGKKACSTITAAAAAVPLAQTGSMTARCERERRGADMSVKKNSGKRSRFLDNCDDEEAKEAKKRNLGEEEEEEEKEVSSAVSSPLYEPYIPREIIGHDSSGTEIYKPIDSETFRTYDQLDSKFSEKLARQMKLPTLDGSLRSTCFDDPKLLHLRDSATGIVLGAGKSVFSLSSSVGQKPLAQCTGFLIELDEDKEYGIILTSADIICTKSPSLDSWLCKDEFAPNSQVIVHFVDKTTEVGSLLYYQKHYNIALFRAKMRSPVELLSFNENVRCGQEVFMLGRDENSNLRVSYGQVQYSNPNLYERYHVMYTYGAGADTKCSIGGPVIDVDRKILGMSNSGTKGCFVPASIILEWLNLWTSYDCIPRPHLGLKLWAIKFLDVAQIERIQTDCGTTDGLVVKEVSYGSFAEKCGIRVGDIIECLNGEAVSSTVELEKILLQLSDEHLSRRENIDSTIDVWISVYRTRKCTRRNIKIRLNVSDEGEEVIRGSYPVNTEKGVAASVLPEQVDPGSPGSADSIGERKLA
ncbi:hypothetical protein ACP4OV_002410 [Aristida adscensionis]